MLSSPTSQELADACLETEAYAEQVSRDLEELTWLRCLSEQLESCDATWPLSRVAERVLPELRAMIRADSIVLLGSFPDEAAEDTGHHPLAETIYSVGTPLVEDGSWRRLVEALTASDCEFPLIRNRISSDELPDHPVIHSCIVVPVARQNLQYGWLLAFNRVQHNAILFAQTQHVGLPGEDEFGTEEAGLLQAAARALATHARNAQLLREKELLLIGVVRALINAIDAKDAYTWGHSDRVALIARRLGEQLQLDSLECERLYTAGLLHDVGKIGVPDSILQKAGPLTGKEFNEIKRHPEVGYAILQHLQQLAYVLPGVLYHHESVDGRGYPHALRGNEIPLFGRILAVADTYDAMTSCRPYRTAMSPDVALSRLREGAGRQWDARVVAAFLECSADIQRLCREARGQALHGAVCNQVTASDRAEAPCDDPRSSVTTPNHQGMP